MLAPKSTSPKKRRVHRSSAHRLRSVRLVLAGRSTVEVAVKFGDSQTAVSKWVRRFKERGEAGLGDLPRSGRPSTLTPSQEKKLRAFVARTLTVSGGTLALHLREKLGVSLTRRQCERILKKLRDEAED